MDIYIYIYTRTLYKHWVICEKKQLIPMWTNADSTKTTCSIKRFHLAAEKLQTIKMSDYETNSNCVWLLGCPERFSSYCRSQLCVCVCVEQWISAVGVFVWGVNAGLSDCHRTSRPPSGLRCLLHMAFSLRLRWGDHALCSEETTDVTGPVWITGLDS